ncbi:hypothetical protein M8C21_009630, partial [Ambrosia artemisiifolia]
TVVFASGLQRCGKSCRLRWINYLRPDIRRGKFTPEEEKLIINLHSVVGNNTDHAFWGVIHEAFVKGASVMKEGLNGESRGEGDDGESRKT